MADLYSLGQDAAALPGRAGAALRRAPRTLAELALAPFAPAASLGASLNEGAQEFGAGLAGLPSREEMVRQIPALQEPPASIARVAQAPPPAAPEPTGIALAARQQAAATPEPEPGGIAAAAARMARADGPTDAIRAGAFRGSDMPDWGVDVSAAQLERDADARDLLARAHAGRMRQVEMGDDARGDAMQKSIEGRQRTLAYESMMPAGSLSSIRATYGAGPLQGAEIGSDAVGDREPGLPTIAQFVEAQQRQAAQFKPQDRLELERQIALDKELQGLGTLLVNLKAQLENDVNAGKLTKEMATAQYQRAQQEFAAMRIQALQGGSLAAWGPQKQDMMADVVGRPPGS